VPTPKGGILAGPKDLSGVSWKRIGNGLQPQSLIRVLNPRHSDTGRTLRPVKLYSPFSAWCRAVHGAIQPVENPIHAGQTSLPVERERERERDKFACSAAPASMVEPVLHVACCMSRIVAASLAQINRDIQRVAGKEESYCTVRYCTVLLYSITVGTFDTGREVGISPTTTACLWRHDDAADQTRPDQCSVLWGKKFHSICYSRNVIATYIPTYRVIDYTTVLQFIHSLIHSYRHHHHETDGKGTLRRYDMI
jgi:hypothetical protein